MIFEASKVRFFSQCHNKMDGHCIIFLQCTKWAIIKYSCHSHFGIFTCLKIGFKIEWLRAKRS